MDYGWIAVLTLVLVLLVQGCSGPEPSPEGRRDSLRFSLGKSAGKTVELKDRIRVRFDGDVERVEVKVRKVDLSGTHYSLAAEDDVLYLEGEDFEAVVTFDEHSTLATPGDFAAGSKWDLYLADDRTVLVSLAPARLAVFVVPTRE